jgi:histidinol-phosphate aminotransferase
MQGAEERRLRRMTNTPQRGANKGTAADDALPVTRGPGKTFFKWLICDTKKNNPNRTEVILMRVPEYIANLKAYVPGKPIEELEREYGISNSIKLASNENPLGPSPKALAAMEGALRNLHRYPDGYSYRLREALGRKLQVSGEEIVFGNGSNEIIELLVRTFIREGDEVVIPVPSFLMYEILVQAAGARPVAVPLKDYVIDLEKMAQSVTPKTRMVVVNNPNNPTGTIVSKETFEGFLNALPPEVIVLLDEAYIEFVRDESCPRGTDYLSFPNGVVTLRTFSKAYGLAGLRIGYGVMNAEMAGYMNRVRQPFNANMLAQIGALAALEDDDFVNRTVRMVHEELDLLYGEVSQLGLRFFRTQTNFFLIDVQRDAQEVFQMLLRKGVIVRAMTSYGYPNFIRVSVGLPAENRRFVKALGAVIEESGD